MMTAYDEFVDFIASGTTPETLIQFRNCISRPAC